MPSAPYDPTLSDRYLKYFSRENSGSTNALVDFINPADKYFGLRGEVFNYTNSGRLCVEVFLPRKTKDPFENNSVDVTRAPKNLKVVYWPPSHARRLPTDV